MKKLMNRINQFRDDRDWRKFHNGTWWEVYYPLSNIRRSFNLTEYVEHEAACMLQDIDQDGYVDLVLRQNTSTWGISIVMVGLKKRIGLERHLVVVLLYFLLLFLNRIFIVPL